MVSFIRSFMMNLITLILEFKNEKSYAKRIYHPIQLVDTRSFLTDLLLVVLLLQFELSFASETNVVVVAVAAAAHRYDQLDKRRFEFMRRSCNRAEKLMQVSHNSTNKK